MNQPSITDIIFHESKTNSTSLVGFASFTYNGISLNDLSVHILKEPKGSIVYRLVYPEKKFTNSSGQEDKKAIFFPKDKFSQEFIDKHINAYLLTNFPNIGARHGQRLMDQA